MKTSQQIYDKILEWLINELDWCAMWRRGNTKTTEIGYVNRNSQKVHGTRGVDGNDHGQYSYEMECMIQGCGHVYNTNGTGIFQRKCPRGQGGRAGIEF